MNKIYIVTTFRSTKPTDMNRHRVGWFHKFKDAGRVLLKNSGDVYEDGYYPFAMIEEVKEGAYPYDDERVWFYQWDKEKKRYCPIDRPEELGVMFILLSDRR